MRPFFRLALTICGALALTGCTQLGLSNPFDTSSDVTETYISRFQDVPIPRDMTSSQDKSVVTPLGSGTASGLETFGGRVDHASLERAMNHNMTNQGWSLRSMASGKRSLQVFEKNQQICVILMYEEILNTVMEVWMLSELGGASPYPAAMGTSSSSSGIYSPSAPASSVMSGSSSDVQPLSQ